MSAPATAVSLVDRCFAMVAALEEALLIEIPGIQIVPFMNPNPSSSPSIDIYPGAPFQIGAGFASGNNQVFWIVRARVTTPDLEGGMTALYRLLDPSDPACVENVLAAIDVVIPADGGISELREYPGNDGAYLGCEWRLTDFL